MENKEAKERFLYGDPRVYNEMQNIKLTDKSFQEKGLFGMVPKYKQHEVREIYFNAIAFGINRGLEIGSIGGQKVELYGNAKTNRQKEYLDKLYKLSEEYNCAIVYHPYDGMVVMQLNNK